MASKPARDLVAGDRILWDLNIGPTVLIVDVVLIIPPPSDTQVAIQATRPDGEAQIVTATYEQEITLADDL